MVSQAKEYILPLLREAFPTVEIYTEPVPQQPAQPCFVLLFTSTSRIEMNRRFRSDVFVDLQYLQGDSEQGSENESGMDMAGIQGILMRMFPRIFQLQASVKENVLHITGYFRVMEARIKTDSLTQNIEFKAEVKR